MTPEQAEKAFLSVHEAKQEFLGASFGTKNSDALENYLEEHPEMRDLEEWEVFEELTR